MSLPSPRAFFAFLITERLPPPSRSLEQAKKKRDTELAKINYTCLTEVKSRYYRLSLIRTLPRGPYSVCNKGVDWGDTCDAGKCLRFSLAWKKNNAKKFNALAWVSEHFREQRNIWKGSPVFPVGMFQTEIRVPSCSTSSQSSLIPVRPSPPFSVNETD